MSSRLEIPPGLTDLLQTFVIQVLRQKPDDLVGFAAQYFNNLQVSLLILIAPRQVDKLA